MTDSNNISATVLKQSVSPHGISITTFKLRYHRYIHSELRTHRLFSMNSASSRAIPLDRNIEYVIKTPATPIHWGANKRGMSADVELTPDQIAEAKRTWLTAMYSSVDSVRMLNGIGLHKQQANRLLEPYMFMNTILTAVDMDNFYYLRRNAEDYKDAQPELAELAEKMYKASQAAETQLLNKGEWHTPFVDLKKGKYYLGGQLISKDTALKVSSSICAQVSYRREDDSIEKADAIWSRLVEGSRLHGSALEHCATPIVIHPEEDWRQVKGISHQDKNGYYWSGNFRGWIQYRKMFDTEAKWSNT